VKSFPSFSQLEIDNSGNYVNTMMTAFPDIMKKLDPLEIGKIALWLYEEATMDVADRKGQVKTATVEPELTFFQVKYG
jgi:hypothetical protein